MPPPSGERHVPPAAARFYRERVEFRKMTRHSDAPFFAAPRANSRWQDAAPAWCIGGSAWNQVRR
jgi:hypothetical protein